MTDSQSPGFDVSDRPTGPLPTVAAKPAVPARTPVSKAMLAVIGVLVVALGAMTALWISTNNQLSALQQSVTAAAVARTQVPDVRAVADKHFAGVVPVSGDADSVSITITTYSLTQATPALRNMLDELGFSSAVIDRMGRTRALDGTLEAEGRNCNVTWTYHPDNGLQMVFEAVPAG